MGFNYKLFDRDAITGIKQVLQQDNSTGNTIPGYPEINTKDIFKLYVHCDKGKNIKVPTAFCPDSNITTMFKNMCTPYLVRDKSTPRIQFLMQNINDNFQESVTPVKNFSEGFVTYAFGSEPAMFSYQGLLMNTGFDNWAHEFECLYYYFLRATRLAELSVINNAPIYAFVTYQHKLVFGSITSLVNQHTADVDNRTSFSFNFLAKKVIFDTTIALSTSTATSSSTTNVPPNTIENAFSDLNNQFGAELASASVEANTYLAPEENTGSANFMLAEVSPQ